VPRLLRVAMSLLLLALGLFGAEAVARAYGERLLRQQHHDILVRTTEIRSRLESALNSTVFLAQGLNAYIASVGMPTEPQVSRALKALRDSDARIRNVALAPGNRLTWVYPLRGNEKALGLRYEDNALQWPSVRKAMETRQSVLAGPVRLVQGGTAIINRTPVFLADDRYWGVISTVIDLPRLLGDVGLREEVDGVRYWLYGDMAVEGADTRIVGDPRAPGPEALRMVIEVPGGHWQLMSEPAAGWDSPRAELQLLRALLYTLSAVLAGFSYALMSGRATAHQLAQQLRALNNELLSTNRELHRLSHSDVLTRLPNRRSFEEAFSAAWRSCLRHQLPLSILMIDLDRFKSINDSHGHAVGDATLVEVAGAIQAQLRRQDDLVARYGGEEFIVMTVDRDAADTVALAERIREAVAACRVPLPEGVAQGPAVTVSIGIATALPTAQGRPEAMIDRADRALYAAKDAGRNCVCVAGPAAPAG